MGGDGGSIPKRTEMVKMKKKKASANDLSFGASLISKWTHCKLSNTKLEYPILIDRLGNLFNKQAILQHLISRKHKKAMINDLNHIQKFSKDLIHCKIRFRSDINKNNGNGSKRNSNEGIFECPITGIVANGKYPFVCLTNCGCVISERAIKNIRSTDDCCLICNEPMVESDEDMEYILNVIPLNPLPERKILLLEDIQKVLKKRQIRKQKKRPKVKRRKKRVSDLKCSQPLKENEEKESVIDGESRMNAREKKMRRKLIENELQFEKRRNEAKILGKRVMDKAEERVRKRMKTDHVFASIFNVKEREFHFAGGGIGF